MGEAKVAVIAFQAAIGKTNEFQTRPCRPAEEVRAEAREMKTLSDEVDGLTKQLQDQGTQLGESERVSRAEHWTRKRRNWTAKRRTRRANSRTICSKLIGSVAEKVGHVDD